MATVSLPARPAAPHSPRTVVFHADTARGSGLGQDWPRQVILAVLLSVLGVASLWPTTLLLWSLWTTDPLKSIGGFVPLISLWLVLRVWRALDWETRGSWWGLAVLAATILAVHLRDGAVLELVVTPSWSITLPPHSLVAVAYASGLVLLFGGTRLWRAGWFPIALMWLVNPLPHVFNRWVDLPLQHTSAGVARGLAHALGQRLTPGELYLMFTPDFGMFIAPGCNGIRGSVTLGLIALVAGYLYRFRLRVWVAFVAGAVLLGYVFNLLRLCVLVLYYLVALHWPWLQGHAEAADYGIGATLFFLAAILLFAAVRRFHPAGELRIPAQQGSAIGAASSAMGQHFLTRAAALALLFGVASVPYARGILHRTRNPKDAEVRFPAAMGPYQLRRTWPEKLDTGQTIFDWAEYAVPGSGSAVQMGVSPVLGAHDTLLCHAARGEDWIWHGLLQLPTQEGDVAFSGSLFNDGATQFMEATTVCSATSCGQWASDRTHLGLVYSRPDPQGLLGAKALRPVPILLHVETTNALLPPGVARAQLTDALRTFTANTAFVPFAYRYLRP